MAIYQFKTPVRRYQNLSGNVVHFKSLLDKDFETEDERRVAVMLQSDRERLAAQKDELAKQVISFLKN